MIFFFKTLRYPIFGRVRAVEFQGLSAACCREPSGAAGAVFGAGGAKNGVLGDKAVPFVQNMHAWATFIRLVCAFTGWTGLHLIGPGRAGQASRQLWPNRSVQLSAVPQFSSPQANAVSHQPFPPQVSTARLSRTQPSPAQHSPVHLTAASHFDSARVGLAWPSLSYLLRSPDLYVG